MSSDIKLVDNDVIIDGTMSIDGTINLKNNAVVFKGHDLVLDSHQRRGSENENVPRRALVHDSEDGLTINFNKSYPSGVTVDGKAKFREAPIVPDLYVQKLGASLAVEELKGASLVDVIKYLHDRIKKLEKPS